ncbi:MAG: hypothetical protein ISR76_04625 [Planctomycetes bacterium]|nr:hypothetical protein [Planctomycetota bacterium]
MRSLVAALLALLLVPWPGGPRPPGADAVRALRSWWAARLVEDASARMDVGAMLTQSEALARLSGNPEPYLFAIHRLGIDQSAPGRGLPPEESLARAREARQRLELALAWLPRPADAVRLHEFLVARRILPLGGQEQALAWSRMAELLASGGPGLKRDPAAYRAFLLLDADGRNHGILGRLRLLGP